MTGVAESNGGRFEIKKKLCADDTALVGGLEGEVVLTGE